LNSLIALLLVLVVSFVSAIPTGATGSTDNGKGAMPAPLRKWGNGGAMGLWGRKRSASLVGMDAYYDEAPANERIWASNDGPSLAKRPEDSWNKLNSLWGKRASQSSWQAANGLWGRR